MASVAKLEWYGPFPSPEAPSYGPFGAAGLEIGGGPHALRVRCRQFDAIDWSERTGLEYDTGDARRLPYSDASFKYVFASNLLEHFPAEETVAVLSEWTRVLVLDGVLDLVVPDAMGILRDYHENDCSWPDTEERLLGSRDYDGNRHYTAFTLSSFPEVIQRVPALELVWIKPSHRGGGIHCVATKRRADDTSTQKP